MRATDGENHGKGFEKDTVHGAVLHPAMPSHRSPLLLLLLPLLLLLLPHAALGSAPTPVVKRVINTAWWPPGTEKTEESVGIVSRGLLFTTGMMETNGDPGPWNPTNGTLNLTAQIAAALHDIGDIARAANSSVAQVCVAVLRCLHWCWLCCACVLCCVVLCCVVLCCVWVPCMCAHMCVWFCVLCSVRCPVL